MKCQCELPLRLDDAILKLRETALWSEMAHGKILQEEIEGRRTSEMRILSSLALDNEPLAGLFRNQVYSLGGVLPPPDVADTKLIERVF